MFLGFLFVQNLIFLTVFLGGFKFMRPNYRMWMLGNAVMHTHAKHFYNLDCQHVFPINAVTWNPGNHPLYSLGKNAENKRQEKEKVSWKGGQKRERWRKKGKGERESGKEEEESWTEILEDFSPSLYHSAWGKWLKIGGPVGLFYPPGRTNSMGKVWGKAIAGPPSFPL